MEMTWLRPVLAMLFVFVPWPVLATEAINLQDKRPKAVVEMFTSQGCGFCLPADELLAELAQSGEVVALAYHIDYWDYLGWRDTLATADNTMRQQQYSQAFGARSVYTPQAIINGHHHLNGAKRNRLHHAISAPVGTDKGGLIVDVNVSHEGNMLVVETGAALHPVKNVRLMVVYFEPVTRVKIDHGKNAGREMTYWNAVSAFHSAGMWHGSKSRYELPAGEVARKGAGGGAVLLQQLDKDGLPGAILGAAYINRLTE